MPQTRSGRESSPSKGLRSPNLTSPEKVRFQPMRSARLRSPSPFSDTSSAAASLQAASLSGPSKSSPRKRTSQRSSSRLSAASDDGTGDEMPMSDRATSAETEDDHHTKSSRAHSVLEVVREDLEEEEQDGPAANRAEVVHLYVENATDDSDDGSTASSSSSDASSSTTSSDSDSDSDEDEEEEDDSAADLSSLLKASEAAYKSRASQPLAQQSKAFDDDQDVISFSDVGLSAEAKSKSSHIPLVEKAKAKLASSSSEEASTSKLKPQHADRHIETFESGKVGGFQQEKKSRGLKAKEIKEATTGSGWFDMPEFGGSDAKLRANTKRSAAEMGKSSATGGDARVATAEQLRKEVQAMRLRNALDPKRFYRSGAKERGMPKYGQIGTIIASPLEPKNILNRRERGRTVVEELIRDAESASYAKRKFKESQDKSASGRGHKTKQFKRRKH